MLELGSRKIKNMLILNLRKPVEAWGGLGKPGESWGSLMMIGESMARLGEP
jgi:hypothetical protein